MKRFAEGILPSLKWPRIGSNGRETAQREADPGPSSQSPPAALFPDGIKVWHDCPDATVDICFVHGLTGDRESTWAAPGQSAPWPKTLLPPRLSKARILTYGYDAYVVRTSVLSTNRLIDHATNLLTDLTTDRTCFDASCRPLVFVAHSLGGLVCKEAVLLSRNNPEPHLRGIFDCAKGIVFMGTPHKGSWMADWANIPASAIGLVMSANKSLLEILETDNQLLEDIQVKFWQLIREQREGGRRLEVTCFFEELPLPVAGAVVSKESATLEGYTSLSIYANHRDMARFVSADDNGFKRLLGELIRWESQTAPKSLDEEQKQVLLDSLRFDQIDARHETIKKAHAKTCKWLLKKSEYLDWLDHGKLAEHHGFLWIKGKPGTGKSTLMKFALADARKGMKHKIIMSFFFNARGDDLEKSTTGMYRSLLLQLLERLPGLQGVFGSLGSATSNGSPRQWSVELLKELFEQAVLGLGKSSLVCFIDALDECPEPQIRDMIRFFEYIGEQTTSAGITFQVCFSSRYYPHITISKGLNLDLDNQEGHTQDIVSYLDSELRIEPSKLSEQIRVDLREKASGVFMWVVLVVGILQREYDHGRKHTLRQRLRDIPGDLHELFRDILTRDHRNRGELLLCIQWVLFARQPLKPEQLYFAVLSGVNPTATSDWNPGEIEEPDIKKYILGSSKGLAEVTRSKIPTVQFIHESVNDFLLKKNGLKEIWPDLGGNLQGQSHERLKQCCLDYMNVGIADLNIGDSLPKVSSQQAAKARQSADKAFPFLEYAVRNVLYHADAAEGGGVSQTSFLQTFQLADWIKYDNLFEKHNVRRHTPKASRLYILAEHNLASLIRSHSSKLSYFEVEGERYGPPIFAALATGSRSAVGALLKAQVDTEPLTSPLRSLCELYCQDRNKPTSFGRDFTFSRRKGVLSHVAEYGDEVILAFLLASGKFHADSKDGYGRTPLSYAAANGHEDAVKLLLEKGANIESTDKDGRTPLSYATANGLEDAVKLLLDKGANIESIDKDGRTPLSYAAVNGHEDAVKLLLEKGANIESTDKDGRTPLLYAAAPRSYSPGNWHEAPVKLLLDKGANIESTDKDGRTPLSYAAVNGHEDAVKLLLEKGANIESTDKDSGTPLSYAAAKGHEAVVKLLQSYKGQSS